MGDQAFAAAGLPAPPPPLVQCESFNGVVAVLARTDMLTFVARRLLAHPIAREVLQEIPVTERLPQITHGIFTRADAPLTPAAAVLAKSMAAVGRGLARRG